MINDQPFMLTNNVYNRIFLLILKVCQQYENPITIISGSTEQPLGSGRLVDGMGVKKSGRTQSAENACFGIGILGRQLSGHRSSNCRHTNCSTVCQHLLFDFRWSLLIQK